MNRRSFLGFLLAAPLAPIALTTKASAFDTTIIRSLTIRAKAEGVAAAKSAWGSRIIPIMDEWEVISPTTLRVEFQRRYIDPVV